MFVVKTGRTPAAVCLTFGLIGFLVLWFVPQASSDSHPVGTIPAPPDVVTYGPPVTNAVIDGFRPPSRYAGPGNRGLEYDTVGGEVVLASAAGDVTFAGSIGDAHYVTIRHADGIRTSYSLLRAHVVASGDVVAAGQSIGVAGSGFHFGARVGSNYLDPAVLLLPVLSARTAARLVPVTLPAAGR